VVPRGAPIAELTVVRLNEPEEEPEELRPWPPPQGLAPDEDPFAGESARRLPSFALPDEPGQLDSWKLTRERAIYGSVILHLLLVIAILVMPPSKTPPKKLSELPDPLGIIKMMTVPPREQPIPIQFFPAPGAATKAPGKSPLPSDANRQAHGGDSKLPKSATPNAVPKQGIRDLAEGARAAAVRAEQAAKAAEGAPDGQPAPPRTAESLLALARPKGDGGTERTPLKGISRSALSGITAEEAARAAKQGEAGDEGAGWEKQGGFVDSGPLSFDTAGYDWGAYAAAMIRKIKHNWDVPSLAYYGIKGAVTIRFTIRKDGRVEDERILRSSGIPPYDNAAFQAIAHASPFKPLPEDLGHDREGVTVTFFYNLRPEDAAGGPRGQ